MATRDDLIYTAGIVDGEGCIGMDKHRNWSTFTPYVMIGNTDPTLIDWLVDTFGGKVQIVQQNKRWKIAYRWELTGFASLPFVRAIRPYLKLKARQADLILAFYNIHAKWGVKSGAKAPRGYAKEATVIKEALTILNKRGN